MPEPTARQLRAVELLKENEKLAKPLSKGAILGMAGFSPTVQHNPAKTLATPSFKALVDKMLPDDYLLNRQKSLIDGPNENVSGKMIELAHKLKGNLGANPDGLTTININYGNQPSSAMLDGEVVDLFDDNAQVRELPDSDNTTESSQTFDA